MRPEQAKTGQKVTQFTDFQVVMMMMMIIGMNQSRFLIFQKWLFQIPEGAKIILIEVSRPLTHSPR
jgi:hypothetical protein